MYKFVNSICFLDIPPTYISKNCKSTTIYRSFQRIYIFHEDLEIKLGTQIII